MAFYTKKPQKRCDVCLVRRMNIKVKSSEALKPLDKERDFLIKKLNEAVEKKVPAKKDWMPRLEAITASIERIKQRKYAELCSLCAKEPRVLVLRYVEDKVFPVPDELCLDCAMQYEWRCTFSDSNVEEKALRRRERILRETGKLLLCV